MAAPNPYLDMLTKRVSSRQRPTSRVPVCLDPERYDRLVEAREALRDAKKSAPQPDAQGARQPAIKRGATDPVKAAEAAVAEAEESVREATVIVVLAGRTADEISAVLTGDAEDPKSRHTLITDAIARVETVDGEDSGITAAQFAEVLPALSTGEISALIMGVNTASSAPDFPTSRRS